ncbi:cupin domain-containing protein [bacterium]|nr:cupin domain-containing protein [bacterium]
MKDTNYWVEKLNLQPHPEGGFFRETYRSHEIIPQAALPKRFSGDRVFSTSIYFLLSKDNFSAFHRIKQDELWHFYDGTSLTIHIISLDGSYSTAKLGKNIDEGEIPQVVVTAGCFFAAETNDKESFSLTGCTVAPGFDFADFEMPNRDKLIELFPQHGEIIKKFARLTPHVKT